MATQSSSATTNVGSTRSNSTLKNHFTIPYCEALKTVPEAGQSSMARDGSLFVYNPDVVREQFAGLMIQEGLTFNHFDNTRMTRVFQNHLQPKYNHKKFCQLCRDEEVLENEAIALSDEEIALDEAASEARSNGSGGEEIDMTLFD
ncbi:hypothetical protein Tco_0847705 [Tanacetum coccineum]